MTLTQAQKDRFTDYKAVTAALTVADLEASTWALIKSWEDSWMDYIKDGAPPGGDRPPNKPDHP